MDGDGADGMAAVLSLTGHETQIAYDGLEAIQAAVDYRPDVVLPDIGPVITAVGSTLAIG